MDDLLSALAPPALAGRANDIAKVRRWQALSRAGPLVWGRYRGTDVYEVAVVLPEEKREGTPRFRCTCPVRNQPCKHSLALYAIAMRQPGALADEPPPKDLEDWRDADARTSGKPRALPGTASRQAREDLISAGVDDLERWLHDLVRVGIAALPTRAYSAVEEPARRLVDAKAPGLASMVRDLGASAATGPGWQERVVDRIGRLHLLIEGWRRRDSLPSDLRADVASLVGVTVYREEVLAQPAISDDWCILGELLTEDDSGEITRRTLRTWLWGRRSRHFAMLLQFEFFGQQLDRSLRPGHCVEASLCFYPSAFPLRAVVQSRQPNLRAMDEFPGEPGLSAMHERFLSAVERQPWIYSVPITISDVYVERRGDELFVSDDEGVEAPVTRSFSALWDVLAVSGGAPIGLFGEWDGRRLSPLSAWNGQRLVALRTSR